MVLKKKLQSYFNKRCKGILKNLALVSISKDTEAIHELRLEQKKIKAIASLLKQADKNKNFSTKVLKPMVKVTGIIRMAEMNLKILHDHEFTNLNLEREQNSIIENGYTLISGNTEEYKEAVRTLEKHFDQEVDDLKNNDAKNYFTTIISELSIDFLWPVDKDRLHENRKKIKNLIYAIKVLPPKLQENIGLNIKYLEQLQEGIGQWHDYKLTLDLLDQHELNNEPVYFTIRHKETELLVEIKKEVAFFDKKIVMKEESSE